MKAFPLKLFKNISLYRSHYMTRDGKVYFKFKETYHPEVISENGSYFFKGYNINVGELFNDVKKTQAWINFWNENEESKSMNETLFKGQYAVAAIKDGVPMFSTKPKMHATQQEAINEVERLIRISPAGSMFATFRCEAIAVARGVIWL